MSDCVEQPQPTHSVSDEDCYTGLQRGSSTGYDVASAWQNKHASVCIVGGGAAGVHMAAQLKQLGFSNIHLFETLSNVGGKCLTQTKDNVPYEIGFFGNILSEAPNPLQKLVRQYGLQDEEILIGAGSSAEGPVDPTHTAVRMNRVESVETVQDPEDAAPEKAAADKAVADKSAADKVGVEEYDLAASAGQDKGTLSRPSSQPADHVEFKRSVSTLSANIRLAAINELPPFRAMLARRTSNLGLQFSSLWSGPSYWWAEKESRWANPSSKWTDPPLVSVAKQYARLQQKLMGNYPYGMPPQPNPSDMTVMNKPFIQFLKEHQLVPLVPVFALCPITFGYQFLLHMPTFYGLWWYNPLRVTALVDYKLSALKIPQYVMLRCGWQALWQKVVEAENIDLHLGCTVQSITRPTEDTPGVCRFLPVGTSEVLEHPFDLLVLACDLKMGVGLLTDPKQEEQAMAASLVEFTLCSTVFEHEKRSEKPIELYPFPKRSSVSAQVFAMINPRLAIGQEAAEDAKNDTSIVYQFLDRPPRSEDLNLLKRRLSMFFNDVGMEAANVVKQCPFSFFPHFTLKALQEGWPWRLHAMQGVNHTAFVGGGACFDSINEILLYNERLVKKLELD